jgi:mono/diheme cytochrome c family protein
MIMDNKEKKEELFHHSFDGIEEYDNDLPGWWKMLFYVTIAFAFVYLLYYHVLGIGDSSKVEYMKEMNPNLSTVTESGGGILTTFHSPFFQNDENLTPRVEAELKRLTDASFEENLMRAMAKAKPDELAKLQTAFPDVYKRFLTGAGAPGAATETAAAEPTIAEPLKDAKSLATGKQIFETQCFTCHGKLGEGGIGPNMTDDYWIHGGKLGDVIHTIRKGVPEKGMISWQATLSPEQINDVASFIFVKLQGTTPPNAKAPQGDKVAK